MWKNSKGYFHRGILDWEFCNETGVSLPCDLSVIKDGSLVSFPIWKEDGVVLYTLFGSECRRLRYTYYQGELETITITELSLYERSVIECSFRDLRHYRLVGGELCE